MSKKQQPEQPEVSSREAELLRGTELLAASTTPDGQKTPEELAQKELLEVKPLQYNVTDPEQQKAKAEQEQKELEYKQPAENELKEDRYNRDFQEHGLIKPELQRHGTQELDTDGNPDRFTEKEQEMKSQEQEGILPPLHKDSTVLRTDKIALAAREERARKEEEEKKKQEPTPPPQPIQSGGKKEEAKGARDAEQQQK